MTVSMILPHCEERFFDTRNPDRMVHAKMLRVDSEVTFFGLANFDTHSFFLNDELTTAVFGEGNVNQMAGCLEDFSNPDDS